MGACLTAQPVRIWQDSIHLPSYREGDAVAVPQFAAWNSDPANYPYPARNSFTQQREDRLWRTVNLENEYLFCQVLPDLGGHLYGCRDKRNGREMFYANPVVKPGDVGLRGAWVAMGIESNFPIGHTRVSASPVDFAFRADPDGSARAVVEEIDRITGMQWRVEFVLRPASTVLEQRVLLYNRSPARWPYYWWADAGVAFDDPATRLVLPAHVVSTHTTPPQVVAWPVHPEGKDGTLVANHKDAGAWFAYESREPFFAIYKPASRSGLAHVADPKTVPGKKLWLWGTQDKSVQRDLTENFPTYVEMQAGLFQNQNTFAFLEPEQFRSFSDYWIPIEDLGGVARATRDAILNLQRRTDPALLLVELSATHSIKSATVRITQGNQEVYLAHTDLNPSASYSYTLQNASPAPYTVELTDSSGATLLRHTENVYDAATPGEVRLGQVPDPEWAGIAKTEERYFLSKGEFEELHQQWNLAFADYSQGLRQFPQSNALKKSLGRLYLSLNRFEQAAALLADAAAAGDDESVYDLGAAQAMAGRDSEALQTLGRVQPGSTFYKAATLQLACIAARARDDRTALARLQPLFSDPSEPARTGALQVALLRRSNRREEAAAALAKWQAVDPADTMLRFESTLLGRVDEDLWKHLSVDSERVLNLVDEYLRLGMESDALLLLDHVYPAVSSVELEPGAVPIVLNPLIAYYRAYCRSRLGQDASADLRAAAGYTRYLFPYRASSYAVLANASELQPQDALPHLLMARLLMNGLDIDRAVAEWQKARELDPKLPDVHVELARTLLEVKKDLPAALVVLREGLRADPGNAELRALAEHAQNAPSPAPPVSAATPSNPVEIARSALAKAASGDPNGAASMFDARVFSAEKQPDEVRRAYIEIQLQKVAPIARAGQCSNALDLLSRLGEEDSSLAFTLHGFANFMKASHFQYYMARIETICGDEKNARKRLAKISKTAEPVSSPEFVFPILAARQTDPDGAKSKIAAALDQVRGQLAKTADRSLAEYLNGALLEASGHDTEALEAFEQVINSGGDPWLVYLAGVEARQILAALK